MSHEMQLHGCRSMGLVLGPFINLYIFFDARRLPHFNMTKSKRWPTFHCKSPTTSNSSTVAILPGFSLVPVATSWGSCSQAGLLLHPLREIEQGGGEAFPTPKGPWPDTMPAVNRGYSLEPSGWVQHSGVALRKKGPVALPTHSGRSNLPCEK